MKKLLIYIVKNVNRFVRKINYIKRISFHQTINFFNLSKKKKKNENYNCNLLFIFQ